MSLTKQDLKSVEGIVTKIVTKVVTEEVDALAAITAKGFEDVDKRFEQVDQRFEAVDKRFESMDSRLDSMDMRFDRIDDKLNYVDHSSQQRDRELADKIDRVSTMLTGDLEPVYDDIKTLKHRVGKLEKAVA